MQPTENPESNRTAEIEPAIRCRQKSWRAQMFSSLGIFFQFHALRSPTPIEQGVRTG
jgi:hypothetical protein